MEISNVISKFCNEEDWSQCAITSIRRRSKEMIGKYNRSKVVLAIETNKNIINVHKVLIDYLPFEGIYNKKTFISLQENEKLTGNHNKISITILDPFRAKN